MEALPDRWDTHRRDTAATVQPQGQWPRSPGVTAPTAGTCLVAELGFNEKQLRQTRG